jgi:hypothetical protein
MTGASPALVATVTVVFAGAPEGAPPEAVAARLLREEDVSTVRIERHGRPSAYRVDVREASYEDAAERAAALAAEAADDLGLEAEVISVGLLRDDDRTEVFRVGERRDEEIWGER